MSYKPYALDDNAVRALITSAPEQCNALVLGIAAFIEEVGQVAAGRGQTLDATHIAELVDKAFRA